MQYILNQEEYEEYMLLKESNCADSNEDKLLNEIIYMFLSRETSIIKMYNPRIAADEYRIDIPSTSMPLELIDALATRLNGRN